MSEIEKIIGDENGDAVVEAAIIFPIVALIFAALVLVSMYLPARASLQKSTQRAATAMAAEKGDTWLFFDDENMEYYWVDDISELGGIYDDLQKPASIWGDIAHKTEMIVKKTEEGSLVLNSGNLSVNCEISNCIIYKEIMVTAIRNIQIPIDLSFIGFPKQIAITVSSCAAIQNGDEFIREMGLAGKFAEYIWEKYGLADLKESICDSLNETISFMDWK
ncbi:MAG: pilus assembly protein [Oscillospiraceae bacterium]|nr:pilus assembly protein [Oscillospiraceae bacterium]